MAHVSATVSHLSHNEGVMGSSGVRSLDSNSLTVVEVAAKRIESLNPRAHLATGMSGKSMDDWSVSSGSVPERGLPDIPGFKKKEYADVPIPSSLKTKEQLNAFFRSKIGNAQTTSEVNALMRQYNKLSVSSEFETSLPTPLSDPNKDGPVEQLAVVDVERGTKPVTGSMRRSIGLTGPTRTIDIKDKEGLQERLNTGLGKLTKLLSTDDPLDVYISGQPPVIHTLTMYRPIPDQDGKFDKVHYDLNHKSELVRLFEDNGFSHEKAVELADQRQGDLADITKELDEVSQEIQPRSSKSPSFSSSSIGNINGGDPLANAGRASSLFSDKKMMEKLTKHFDEYGLSTNGKLNKHGVRALKEAKAAEKLVEEQHQHLKGKLNNLSTVHHQLKNNPQRDHTDVATNRKISELEAEIEALQGQINKLGSVQNAKFAAAWMIIQLNRPITLVKDGTPIETTVREALKLDASAFTHIRKQGLTGPQDVPMDPLQLRQSLAKQSSMEFNDLFLENDRSWRQVAPGKKSKIWAVQSGPSKEEVATSFELGNLFFYPGVGGEDPSFRIRNQIRHEEMGIRLESEVPGINWLIPAVAAVVTAAENGEDSVDLGAQIAPEASTKVLEGLKRVTPRETGYVLGQDSSLALREIADRMDDKPIV